MTNEDRLREALEIIAAQSSGIPGSTARADCMAAIARLALAPPVEPEQAAQADALDALGVLANINDMACFASEEDTSTQAAVLLQIGELARAALQAQGKAP